MNHGNIAKNINSYSYVWTVTYPQGTILSLTVEDGGYSFGVVGDIIGPGTNTCTLQDPGSLASLTQFTQTANGGAASNTAAASSGSTRPTAIHLDGNAKSKTNVGAIAGGVVGGVVGLLVILGIILYFCCYKRRKPKATDPSPRDRFEIERAPEMVPFVSSQGQGQAMSSSNTGSSPVTTPQLLAAKYDRYSDNHHSDQASSSGVSATPLYYSTSNGLSSSVSNSNTSDRKSLPAGAQPVSPPPSLPPGAQQSPGTRPLPVPPSHQHSGDSYLREEEDAGPVTHGEVLPPRYNPDWEQRAKDSQTGQ